MRIVSSGLSKNNTILKTVERYDPRQDKWNNVTSLNTPRSGACAVVLMGQIFVMGGGSEFRKILSSCEIYDPGQDKWFHGKGKSCNKMLTSFPCQNTEFAELAFSCRLSSLTKFCTLRVTTLSGAATCRLSSYPTFITLFHNSDFLLISVYGFFWQFSIEPERKAGSGRPKYSTELI